MTIFNVMFLEFYAGAIVYLFHCSIISLKDYLYIKMNIYIYNYIYMSLLIL